MDSLRVDVQYLGVNSSRPNYAKDNSKWIYIVLVDVCRGVVLDGIGVGIRYTN